MPTNTAPQSVSRRYAHNLLCRGTNYRYEIEDVKQCVALTPKGKACGFYYFATVKTSVDFIGFSGEGSTPVDAVIDALTAAGVTFR